MTIFTENPTFNIVATVVAIIVVGITYIKWKLKYWERIGLEAFNFATPFGESTDILLAKKSLGEKFQDFYNQIKSRGLKHGGIFLGLKPWYIPVDPDLIKHVMQDDFQHFTDRGIYFNEETDPLSGHLANLEGSKWKDMRVKLTPTFTSGKMKMMFQTLADCTEGLKTIIDTAAKNKDPVDIKEILGRFTTDVIGSTAFGLECNSLKNPDSEFRKYGKRIFEDTFWERFTRSTEFVLPRKVLNAINFKQTKPDVENFFMNVVHQTVDYREKNNIFRKDFMHLLLQLKNRGKVTDDEKIKDDYNKNGQNLTMNEMAAQAFVFFAAGFETSSTTMTFALYELAMNQKVQDKLRDEINVVLCKYDNKLTYEGIMEMTYMQKVLEETLRKHPPAPILGRICTKDYTVPNTNIQIKKGINVGISILGLHKDPEYYPKPEVFDPERFSEENKKSRPSITWIPFGEGPRHCIGLRFGLLQSKVGLAVLLKNYRITLNKKMKLPITIDKKSFITAIEGGVWLDIEKL